MGATALDILDGLGRRWSPRILWELRGGAIGFNELRVRCASMSSSVLATRLRDLSELELIRSDEFEQWELTRTGERLADALGHALDA